MSSYKGSFEDEKTMGVQSAVLASTAPGTEDLYDPDAGLTTEQRAAEERKLLRKLDLKLIPWLVLLYLACFLDRTNIGNAKIAHLTTDLKLDTWHYNDTLTIFFVSYSVFEALANILLKRFKPSIFIPITMVLWGCCMVGMGFVKDWSGLMTARFFLGVTEAGLFPGINYYLSCWYKRDEFAIRAAVFFSAAALSGSFGGLLAAAIQNMNGVAGKPGWAWIFILEGLATVIIGFFSFWMVHDFPDEARFLSRDDRARVLIRLRLDKQQSAEHEEFRFQYLWSALSDWKTYVGMLMYMGPLMPLYSFALFLPTIVSNMGFTTTSSIVKNQLLTVPPYALATVATLTAAFWSDKIHKRALFNLILAPIGMVGIIMLMASSRPAVQYAGCFIAPLGIYPSIPIIIAWVANNVEGVYKRGIVLGFVIGWGNLNGIVSSNIFFDAPRFYQGYGTMLGYMAIGVFGGSVLNYTLLTKENKKRLNGERDHWAEGLTPKEVDALGDQRPDFIYHL